MGKIMNREAISYYQTVSPIIEEFCKPLDDYFGIPFFMYYKIYKKDASYVMLSNNVEAVNEYCIKIENDTFYAQNYLEIDSKHDMYIWPKEPINLGMQIFFNRGYWNCMTIVIQNNDSIENINFISLKDNHRINKFFIRHYSILETFAQYFKMKFVDIIMQSEQCRAVYKNGFNFDLPYHEATNALNVQPFIQTTGINKGVLDTDGKFIHLTQRETECLKLVNKGFSLKGIGNKLLLSPRTIEAHLNNIKNKTGYHRRNDLIHMYRNSFMEINHE